MWILGTRLNCTNNNEKNVKYSKKIKKEHMSNHLVARHLHRPYICKHPSHYYS